MPTRPPEERSFTRRLADFSALACGVQTDAQTRGAVVAAAAALEAEFDLVVSALDERRELLERLSTIQQSITRRADLGETLDAIVAGAAELLGEPIAGLRLVDPGDPDWVDLVSEVGIAADDLAALRRTPASAGAGGRAVTERRLVVVEDYQDADGMLDTIRASGVRAAIAAPVRERGGVVGSLVVASRRPGRLFSAYERAALTAFAEHASLALTDARMVADALHQSVHDPLTGLPNRALFADRIEHALAGSRRRGKRVAVLFCDLDNFKVVNDSLGHHAGDELLVLVAARLNEMLRATDTVARFGGDEFGVLLEDITEAADAVRVARQIGDLFRDPFRLDRGTHVVSVSIGIALSGVDSATPTELIRDADAAMYRAKLAGRDGFEVFDEQMRERAVERLRVERELREAIAGGQLRLDFQPIVALADGAVLGAEALVRWQHPARGLLAPEAFIAVAEESGLIMQLGARVLAAACREAAGWSAPLTVSVNLSPRQVTPALVDDVAAAISESGLDPCRLALEITEGVLLGDSASARGTLKALKALGVQLVLDDFGTGYSSLGYLTRLPLDGLKIDRSFVDGLGVDADDSAIVTAVTGMASGLGLTIIAEGIETGAQLAALQRLACQQGQGFHFAAPMSAVHFRELLERCAALPVAQPVRTG